MDNENSNPKWLVEWGRAESLARAARLSGLPNSKVIKEEDGLFTLILKGVGC